MAKIGFLGAGNMAEALMKGFVGAGLTSWGHISASDVYQPRLDVMTSLGAACRANSEMAAHADTIFVAVKPGQVAGVQAEIAPTLDQSRHVLVSIAAGVTIETLEGALADAGAPDAKVVRVMPNTPCFVGETASAYALGRRATPEDGAAVEKLMGAVGTIHKVDEKLLDAVTGLSGSGPAYVFMTIEAMADGGVAAGLPRPIALNLAAQTVLGGAKMVLETGKHPGELKDMVCSPGGTTIAGVHQLEKAGLRSAFMNAVTAAANRSKELGGK
jgi:pyrroline-5-carboxylate reductase